MIDKEAWRNELKHLFVDRLLVMYLASALGTEWMGETMTMLLGKQVKKLADLGLDGRLIQEAFKTLESWSDRGYGLNFIQADPEVGPEFHLTFLDEMDSDPTVVQMREALKKLHEGN